MHEQSHSGVQARTWPAAFVAAAIWCVCLLWYGFAHPAMAAMAVGGAAYAVVLAGSAWFLVLRSPGPDRLQAIGSGVSLRVWSVIALLIVAWTILYGFAFGGAYGGVQVPWLTAWISDLTRLRLVSGIDGTALLNLTSLGLGNCRDCA